MDKKQFNKLQAKWDAKLKRSGFEDIESRTNDKLANTTTTGGILDQRRWDTWKAQEEYYQLATRFLNEYEFETKVDQVIWDYHANGLSHRDITEILNKVRRKKISRETMRKKIKILEQIMFNRYGVTK